LRHLFDDKCVYCEISLASEPGDIEHYRPKSETKLEPHETLHHHGYFWLCCDPKNLLIACSYCNQNKSSSFPVEVRSNRMFVSGAELDKEEKPLLINPYIHDPEKHIIFRPRTGTLESKTKFGAATLACLKLNDERLVTRRKIAQATQLKLLWASLLEGKFAGQFNKIRAGKTEFSASVLAHVRDELDKIQRITH
jgi:uncharacterized protein (TIGR02646 family)